MLVARRTALSSKFIRYKAPCFTRGSSCLFCRPLCVHSVSWVQVNKLLHMKNEEQPRALASFVLHALSTALMFCSRNTVSQSQTV